MALVHEKQYYLVFLVPLSDTFHSMTISVCLQSLMLSAAYSDLFYITIRPMAFQLQPVIAQQVDREIW